MRYLPLRRAVRAARGHGPLRAHRAARALSPTSSSTSSPSDSHGALDRCATTRIDLALHELRAGDGPPAAAPARSRRADAAQAPGYADRLARPGLGRSTSPATATSTSRAAAATRAEVLMGDADAALAAARPGDDARPGARRVRRRCSSPAPGRTWSAARPRDGPGLAGGGTGPSSHDARRCRGDGAVGAARPVRARRALPRRAPARLRGHVRPPGVDAVRAAERRSRCRARWQPPWLEAVVREPGVVESSIEDALASYASQLTSQRSRQAT